MVIGLLVLGYVGTNVVIARLIERDAVRIAYQWSDYVAARLGLGDAVHRGRRFRGPARRSRRFGRRPDSNGPAFGPGAVRGISIVTLVLVLLGVAAMLIVIWRRLQDRWRANEEIRFLAMHDSLTRLPNRTGLTQYRTETLGKARRAGDQVWVICFDIDRFKSVNDNHGHSAGDMLLKTTAERITTEISESNMVARLSGDEFVAVVKGPLAPKDITAMCLRICEAVARPCTSEGQEISATVSIGVAMGPEDGTTPDILLKNAELALHYQPQFDLGTGELTGFEALLRWNSAELGSVSPGRFIPVAEESGLIGPIGEWAMFTACREAASWDNDLKIVVNLSAAQFRMEDMAGTVKKVLAETGLDPRRLELEITESLLMENTDHTVSVLRQLRKLGVKIAMDDFGTGFSSLSYLSRFPFTKIKIDRSFIQQLDQDEGTIAIVRSIVGLGQSLETVITAEGVETPEQAFVLSQMGCNEVLGFLYGKPRPEAVIDEPEVVRLQRDLAERLSAQVA